jgi:hypothetical protein
VRFARAAKLATLLQIVFIGVAHLRGIPAEKPFFLFIGHGILPEVLTCKNNPAR